MTRQPVGSGRQSAVVIVRNALFALMCHSPAGYHHVELTYYLVRITLHLHVKWQACVSLYFFVSRVV